MGKICKMTPFLRWAGGKRWLVNKYSEYFPTEYNTYIEPFLGGGAVYFHLKPVTALLSDTNKDLINTYDAIKNDWATVYSILKTHHRNHNKEYYYKVRQSRTRTKCTSAAKFIYLNRTCWNGLYRVNSKGKFNVPIGTQKNVIQEGDDFETISERLNNTILSSHSYEKIIVKAKKDDFIFIDPPYTIKHNFNGFILYNEKLFTWDDQIKLKNLLVDAKNRGVKIMLTNADHPELREIYSENFIIERVLRSSVIAGSSKYRGKYGEILVMG